MLPSRHRNEHIAVGADSALLQVFLIIGFGLAMSSNVFGGTVLPEYRSLGVSFLTILDVLIGDYDPSAMKALGQNIQGIWLLSIYYTVCRGD